MIFKSLAAIWFFLILKNNVDNDYEKWEQGIPVNHTKEAFIRALLLIPSTVALCLPFPISVGNIIAASMLQATVWWEFFDGWYNKKRGLPWRFNGSRDKDDSWLDRFLYGLTSLEQTLLKWGLITLSIIIYTL